MKTLVALCLLISLACVAAAQEPATTPQADAGMIQVNVSVTDARERLVTGLTKEAFKLSEDGIEQKIASMSQGKDPNEYVLFYKPTNATKDGGWRKLKVEIDPQVGPRVQLVVRAKQGYYAPTAEKN